jgi:hypothetical protein
MSEGTVYERELYVAITLAWYETQPRRAHIDHALRPYALGTGFALSVQRSPRRVDLQHVAAICALLVRSRPWELDGLQKVIDTPGIEHAPKDELDPLCAWWYPLERPSVLGVHYWELGSGTLELRRLSRFDEPPALQFGRFAAEKQEREAPARSHRPTGRR